MPSALDDLFPRVPIGDLSPSQASHSLWVRHTLDSNALNYGSCIPPQQVQSVFAGNKYINQYSWSVLI